MTSDEILRMAHLAGYIGSYADGGLGEQRFNFSKEQLIEFAKSVAAHERLSCAKTAFLFGRTEEEALEIWNAIYKRDAV